jgi:hypothetical protein
MAMLHLAQLTCKPDGLCVPIPRPVKVKPLPARWLMRYRLHEPSLTTPQRSDPLCVHAAGVTPTAATVPTSTDGVTEPSAVAAPPSAATAQLPATPPVSLPPPPALPPLVPLPPAAATPANAPAIGAPCSLAAAPYCCFRRESLRPAVPV